MFKNSCVIQTTKGTFCTCVEFHVLSPYFRTEISFSVDVLPVLYALLLPSVYCVYPAYTLLVFVEESLHQMKSLISSEIGVNIHFPKIERNSHFQTQFFLRGVYFA